MNNFARALKLALRYRLNMAAAVVCSLVVAVLWGGNIGALYPMVEVVGTGQSLSGWNDRQMADAHTKIAAAKLELSQLEAAADEQGANKPALRSLLQSQIAAQAATLEWREKLKPTIDRYSPQDPFRTLVMIVVALVVATFLKDFFLALGQILVDRLAHLAAFDLRREFYRRTLNMDLASFHENGASELLSRFTYDMDSVSNGVQTVFGRAVREPLKMIACLIGAAWISWQLLLMSLIVAPLAGYLIGRLAKTLKKANRRAMEEMSQLYGVLVETFGAVKVVKAFTMERMERKRFHRINKNCFRKAMRIAVFDGLINPTTEVMGICTIATAILLGAYLVLNQKTHLLGLRMSAEPLTLGALMVFFGMLAGVSDPIRKLAEVFNRIQRAAAASDRVYQLLDREPAVTESMRPVPLPRHHADLTFERIDFRYGVNKPVLLDVSLTIPFGETVAIVGPNGCGKSTLANLIPRFYDPSTGCVRIDGVDIKHVRLRELRRQIGVVTQETQLFDDTVLNNIRYGSPRATRDQVVAAAQASNAHKFISEKLDQGYETMVGAGGSKLSGGQRQRIALARAILRDPAILILDEATSQIDIESEQLIHKSLERLIQGRTVIMITHRLATLELADRIVVMDSGRIADVGTHAQLMERCEVFRRLYQTEMRSAA